MFSARLDLSNTKCCAHCQFFKNATGFRRDLCESCYTQGVRQMPMVPRPIPENSRMNPVIPDGESDLPPAYKFENFQSLYLKKNGMLGDEGFGPLQDGMPLSSRIADLFLASIAQAHHRVAFLPMSTIEMFESFGNCTIWDFQLKEAHFVIVPVHLRGNHLAMFLVFPRGKKMCYYDPSPFDDDAVKRKKGTLQSLFEKQAKAQNFPMPGSWTHMIINGPRQGRLTNDCGAFVLWVALKVSEHVIVQRMDVDSVTFNFTEYNSAYIRRAIAYRIECMNEYTNETKFIVGQNHCNVLSGLSIKKKQAENGAYMLSNKGIMTDNWRKLVVGEQWPKIETLSCETQHVAVWSVPGEAFEAVFGHAFKHNDTVSCAFASGQKAKVNPVEPIEILALNPEHVRGFSYVWHAASTAQKYFYPVTIDFNDGSSIFPCLITLADGTGQVLGQLAMKDHQYTASACIEGKAFTNSDQTACGSYLILCRMPKQGNKF